MVDTIQIATFSSRYQNDAAELINVGLGEHFGFVDDSMNPDLHDIGESYRDGYFLVALDGEQVVGTGAILPVDTETGQVVRMHTASKFRRCGIATRILNALEQRAAARGFRSLILETNLDWVDAISFYLRNGYAELGRNEVGIRFKKSLNTNGK
jgi:GNAT superfamily N-acetyltransferase